MTDDLLTQLNYELAPTEDALDRERARLTSEIERAATDTAELSVSSHLLNETRRNVPRALRRHKRATVAAIIVASLVLVTAIAAAASDRVATFVGKITASTIPDVLDGEPEITEPPSPESQKTLHDMEDLMRGVNPEDPSAARDYDIEPRVLLRQEIDGIDVEIVAYERPVGSPSASGPRKRVETCWSVRTSSSGGAGGVTCSPVFMPALHINYSAETQLGCDGSIVILAGIAASSVRAVRFETADGIEEATMGDGAFWWRSDVAPTDVHVDLVDGSTVSRPYRFGEPINGATAPGCD